MEDGYIVITNNPLVFEKLGGGEGVLYEEVSYEAVLRRVRDELHKGRALLSHPLSGSVKPKETPYKSVMISRRRGETEAEGILMIENALAACKKFAPKADRYGREALLDFQLIDWTLLESAIESAKG